MGGIGEGAYGLIQVSASTGWFYWTLISIAGLAILSATITRGTRNASARLLAVGLTTLVAVAFFFTYTAAGTLTL